MSNALMPASLVPGGAEAAASELIHVTGMVSRQPARFDRGFISGVPRGGGSGRFLEGAQEGGLMVVHDGVREGGKNAEISSLVSPCCAAAAASRLIRVVRGTQRFLGSLS